MSRPQSAVIGPGAIGLTILSALCRADISDVSVFGRSGFSSLVRSGPGDRREEVAISCHTEPTDLMRPADWVFLAVKSHQIASAAPWLERLVDDDTIVVVLQNGVEHEATVRPYVGAAPIVPVAVWFSAAKTGPGVVEVHTRPILVVPDTSQHATLARLLGEDVDVVPTDDFVTETWRKLCRNAVGCVMALTGETSWIFQLSSIEALARRLAFECVAVARAAGASLDAHYGDEIVDSFLAGSPDQGNSMLADRVAGQPLEWEARNGVIVRMGRAHGVPTPVSDVVVPLLEAINARP